jgi:flavin reductase (DIM6/NTAB) family NADH-FMN oxidoreductase RutF
LSPSEVDFSEYRRALGCFATGVAVATVLGRDGAKCGITINSFNSVSLDPPLVLWSIARESRNYATFAEASHFAVNVLAIDQRKICDMFARSGDKGFEGLSCKAGIEGVPILPTYAAVFECRTENRFDGGDHTIIIGRVLNFDDRQTDPLIFYRGHFLE